MAEREGFEPSVEPLTLHSLSRRAPSANSAISPRNPRKRAHNLLLACSYWQIGYPLIGFGVLVNPEFLKPKLHELAKKTKNTDPIKASCQKPHVKFNAVKFPGGGSRIRTHGTSRHNGFQDRRLQPLGHPSSHNISKTCEAYHLLIGESKSFHPECPVSKIPCLKMAR